MSLAASRPRARSLPGASRWGWLLVTLPLLAGCPGKPKPEAPPAQPPAPALSKPAMLEINAFNYTDLYIHTFTVNGQGGGNVFVSSPETGGGGGVCCVTVSPDDLQGPVRMKVEWSRDMKRWCEKEVELTGPIPANPRHLGVHFFPDGRIEAELTEDSPELKLRLERVNEAQRKASGNTVADEKTARCKDAE